ncbi:hydrogenase maturation protease [Amycolatopsis marina]|uniref:Hydrogenase maturation protease n=1 Tax=Amycolatopsis marina TaxID=490629 RepID=A0A1I1C826_9PSEU|nr:hypothetical protein [Amycolatopsis marina]SFB57028.1 hydrogenase maturation protease [Amycolatopsis marina]
MTVLVGGVGQLYQGDLDLGRHAAERLAAASLGKEVVVEELHYGAVAVTQRLSELGVRELIVVGAAQRGDLPGSVRRRRVHAVDLPPERVAESVRDAVTGYVTIDLLLDVASGLGTLPARTVSIEVEPAWTQPGEYLSAEASTGLELALQLVTAEVGRLPLLELVDRLRPLTSTDRLEFAPALRTIRMVLDELETLDDAARWGATFSLRDRLRDDIANGQTPEGMDHQDWALWWALIEELDRCQVREAAG